MRYYIGKLQPRTMAELPAGAERLPRTDDGYVVQTASLRPACTPVYL